MDKKRDLSELVACLHTGKCGCEVEHITEQTLAELSDNKGDDEDE